MLHATIIIITTVVSIRQSRREFAEWVTQKTPQTYIYSDNNRDIYLQQAIKVYISWNE
jgi:hypothetical protein